MTSLPEQSDGWTGPISLREVLIEMGIEPTRENLQRAAAFLREEAAREGLEVRTIEVRPAARP